MELTVVKETLGIIKEYQDKDYFGDSDIVKRQIANRDRAIAGGQEDARQYSDELIERVTYKNTRVRAFYSTAMKLHKAILDKDKDFILSRVRYDQDMTKKLFTLYTGIKLPRTNKEIRKVVEGIC